MFCLIPQTVYSDEGAKNRYIYYSFVHRLLRGLKISFSDASVTETLSTWQRTHFLTQPSDFAHAFSVFRFVFSLPGGFCDQWNASFTHGLCPDTNTVQYTCWRCSLCVPGITSPCDRTRKVFSSETCFPSVISYAQNNLFSWSQFI
jgi:hypothetical protein